MWWRAKPDSLTTPDTIRSVAKSQSGELSADRAILTGSAAGEPPSPAAVPEEPTVNESFGRVVSLSQRVRDAEDNDRQAAGAAYIGPTEPNGDDERLARAREEALANGANVLRRHIN